MKNRDGPLELVRGLSALLVMTGHLRGGILIDYGSLPAPNLALKALYFATGLGHQAVMVFFVLSGHFVGSSVLRGLMSGRFSWSDYALARLSRLWVVLIPALLLTLGFDLIGNHWHPSAYAGQFYGQFISGPSAGSPVDNGFGAFLGNVAFLQTLTVPVYGSNGPLWSLAYEFWYYLLFPLMAVFVFQVNKVRNQPGAHFGLLFVHFLLLAVLVWWLPAGLLFSGLIWLLGVVVWLLAAMPRVVAVAGSRLYSILLGFTFLAALAASKSHSFLGSDIVVGVAFAGWMLSLRGPWSHNGWWSRLSSGLSEISYTLYVVHFPILFFIATVVLNGQQFAPKGPGLAFFAGLVCLLTAVSAGLWWLFERNTPRVRLWMVQHLGRATSRA
jgi:peptidoglycan/LPS O-acetylase OafA/YrhL